MADKKASPKKTAPKRAAKDDDGVERALGSHGKRLAELESRLNALVAVLGQALNIDLEPDE